MDASALIKAMNHPMRIVILKELRERGSPSSPTELADALGEPVSNVCYHVGVLDECEAVIMVGTKPKRGSTEHFYEFNVTEEWALIALETAPTAPQMPKTKSPTG